MIGFEIVGHLGCQPSNIDGVGRGEAYALFLSQIVLGVGGEDIFHAGLGIVEVALYRTDLHVFAPLGHHLGSLHGGYAAVGIEYTDLDAGYVLEACQCCFTGVAGCGSQNQNGVLHHFLLLGSGNELGEHAQRHIFEGGGGAVEEFEYAVGADGAGGRELGGAEFMVVGLAYEPAHVFDGGEQGG